MIFPTKKNSPELHPYRHGLYFSFFNALNWQVAIGTPTVLFMQQLGADSFQVGLGKNPNSEMMKLMQRDGCMFVCGWLPPDWTAELITTVAASSR